MKEIIKLLTIFLFIFLIILCFLTFLYLLYSILSATSGSGKLSPANYLAGIPFAVLRIFVPAMMLSVLIIFFYISLRPVPTLPVSLGLAILALLLFYGGLVGISMLQTGRAPRRSSPESIIVPGKVNKFDRFVIIPERLEYDFLFNCLVMDLKADTKKFSFHPRVGCTVQGETLTFIFEDFVFSTELASPGEAYLREYDRFSFDFLGSFRHFNDRYCQLAEAGGWNFLLSGVIFIFFLITGGLFSRITRWPLFNLFLYCMILTGIIWLFHYYITDILPELEKLLKNTNFLSLIPDLTLLVSGVVFLLVDIIFVPRKYWKEGISND